MSSFLDNANAEVDLYDEAEKACKHLQESLPCLYAVLTGVRPQGAIPGVAPGGIRIYTNGGVLKAAISSSTWKKIGYLDCGKHLTSLVDIEAAIAEGSIAWNDPPKRNNSYPDPAF